MSAILALAFALCPAPTSEPARIVGTTQYTPHSLVRLKAEGAAPGAAIVWRVYPRADVHRASTRPDVLEFAARPGVYEIECLIFTQRDGGLAAEELTTRVTISTAEAKPGAGKLDPINATGKLRFGGAGCTATVIGPRRADGRWDVLTAAHCVGGVGDRGTITLKDGRTLGLKVAVHNEKADFAWAITDDAVEGLAYATLAAGEPAVGVKVWHQGYGIDKPGNREDGFVDAQADDAGQLRMVLSVSPGDSGSGVFRDDTGELVAVVCCTTGLGERVRMWGASSAVILKARPTRAP